MRPSVRFLLVSSLLLVPFSFGRHAAAVSTVSKISVAPTSATLVAGQAQTFAVTATATDGSTSDVTSQATLSSDDPRGTFSGAAYTPGKVGTWTIQASYQSLTTTAGVTVSVGAVQELTINPNSEPEPTTIGKPVTFSVMAYDAHSNIISDQAVTWSVIGDIGSINAQGVFTPSKVGTGKVQATAGAITGQVSVVTQAAPVVNTNTAAVNTNATNKNTNSTNQNANTNQSITSASTSTNTPDECTTLKPWAWTVMLIIFMLVVVALYALVPVTKIWPVVVALIAAAVLAFVQRKYGCGTQSWWAWVMTLGTIALSAVANTMRPKSTPTV